MGLGFTNRLFLQDISDLHIWIVAGWPVYPCWEVFTSSDESFSWRPNSIQSGHGGSFSSFDWEKRYLKVTPLVIFFSFASNVCIHFTSSAVIRNIPHICTALPTETLEMWAGSLGIFDCSWSMNHWIDLMQWRGLPARPQAQYGAIRADGTTYVLKWGYAQTKRQREVTWGNYGKTFGEAC